MKSLLMHIKFPRTNFVRTVRVPSKANIAFVMPQSVLISLHILIALKYLTLVCDAKSILVEVMSFAMDELDNFWKENELITV